MQTGEMRVAVCDDTDMEAQHLAELVAAWGREAARTVRVDRFDTAEALNAALDGGAVFHLCLVDVVLPGMDGLAFLRRRRQAGGAPPVVLLSASAEYAAAADALGAAGYLVKPVGGAALAPLLAGAATAAAAYPRAETAGDALIRLPGHAAPLPAGQVLWARRQGGTLQVTLRGGGTLALAHPRRALAALRCVPGFIPLGGNGCVNAAWVERVDARGLAMTGGVFLPLRPKVCRQVSAAYLGWLAGQGGG